ncbi:MAG TPA: helix-turn-helix domain-containing protein [Polyangiaceae bacterium]
MPLAGSDIDGANESAAARALATGDALRALSVVGRATGPLPLALRGIAYAQLGDLEAARDALERAAKETRDRRLLARVRAALVEVALGEGDVARAVADARASAHELTLLGDLRNAAMQRLVLARAAVLLGRVGEARGAVAEVLATELPPDVRAVASLAEAEIATRALAATDARSALSRARPALERTPNRLLAREIDALEAELSRPVARLESSGAATDADLFAIERAANGALFLVDACRRLVVAGRARIPLARRPVLFTLVVELARAAPASVRRDVLAARVFEARRINASHRGRLRVEIGRLRKLLDGLDAEPVATADGYALVSRRKVALLVPRDQDDASRVALLLGDGATWSAQRVSETAGISKRTAQRALGDLVASGRAVRIGSGRNVRYHRPAMPIASRMLLLGLAPNVSEEHHGDTP